MYTTMPGHGGIVSIHISEAATSRFALRNEAVACVYGDKSVEGCIAYATVMRKVSALCCDK